MTDDVRQSIAACLLGETLGDGHGVDVLRVADLLIEGLPKMGYEIVKQLSKLALYGHKCHLCSHLDGPTHHVERHWPVADDECPDCSFCQEAAFIGAFIRSHGGDELFDPGTRAAVKALMAGKTHPVVDRLREELRPPTPEGGVMDDEMMNNLVAAGALWMSLSQAGLVAEPILVDGNATNALVVRFHFLKSPYRVTVERIDEETEAALIDGSPDGC